MGLTALYNAETIWLPWALLGMVFKRHWSTFTRLKDFKSALITKITYDFETVYAEKNKKRCRAWNRIKKGVYA